MPFSLSRRSTSSKPDPQVEPDPPFSTQDWYNFLLMSFIAAATVTISYSRIFPISSLPYYKMLENLAGVSARHLGSPLKPAVKELEDVLVEVNRMIKNATWAKLTIPLFHSTSEPVLNLVSSLVAVLNVDRTWKALAIDEPGPSWLKESSNVANVTNATPATTQSTVVSPVWPPASSHWWTWACVVLLFVLLMVWTFRSRRHDEGKHTMTTGEDSAGQTIIKDSMTLVGDDGDQEEKGHPSNLRAVLSPLVGPLFEDSDPTNSKVSPLPEDNRGTLDDALQIPLPEDDSSDWGEVGSAAHTPKDDGEERDPVLLIPHPDDDGVEWDPALYASPPEGDGEEWGPAFCAPFPEDDEDPDVVDTVPEYVRDDDDDDIAIQELEVNEVENALLEPYTSRPLSNLTNTVYLPSLILPALPPLLPTNLTVEEDQSDHTPSSKPRQVRPRAPTTNASSSPSTLGASDNKTRNQRRRIKQKLNKKNKYLVPLLADIILDVKIETAPEEKKSATPCADAGRAVADDLEELPKVSADVSMDAGKKNSPRLPAPPIPYSSPLPSRQSATHPPEPQIPAQSESAVPILAPQPTHFMLRQQSAHSNTGPSPSSWNSPGELCKTKNQLRRAKQKVNKRNKYLEPLLSDIVLDEYHRRRR